MSSDLVFKVIALVIYFAAMLAIGFFAFKKTDDGEDYMLGGRRLHPFTAALSAGAADMSGWLLMGLPGALYMTGLVSAWIAVGLTVGAAANWFFTAPRLRVYTEIADNSLTVPSFFSNRLHDRTRLLRIAAGVVILVFFTFYVSSGMAAGGKFFESSFGGSYLAGMLLIAGVTIIYTVFGGFLGATYTDVVQGIIMFVSLITVPLVAMFVVGGPTEMFDSVMAVNKDFGSMTKGPDATWVAIASSLAWGLGYFGQPHIIVRFMALRSSKDARYGMVFGISWMALSVVGAIFTALAGLAYFHQHGDAGLTDKKAGESVFLDLAQILFHPLIAGILLAAVLAAIMSTVSSQLVVSSSALVEDLLAGFGAKMSPVGKLWAGRIGVLVISVIAVLLALNPNSSILGLVAFAWAGFGAAFGPIVILSLYWRRLTMPGALVGMVVGAVVSFWWGKSTPDVKWHLFAGDQHLYEIIPGFLLCLILAIVVSLITPKPPKAAMEEYDEMLEAVKTGVVRTADGRIVAMDGEGENSPAAEGLVADGAATGAAGAHRADGPAVEGKPAPGGEDGPTHRA